MRPDILISTNRNGTMKGVDSREVAEHRRYFLEVNGHNPHRSAIVRLTYGEGDYCRYKVVDEGQYGDGITHETGIVCDALLTNTPGISLFLPLADCIGAVLYDKAGDWLMVSHLGRHNLEQNGGQKSVEYFREKTGLLASSINIFMTPAAGSDSYPLFSFSGRSLHNVATEQLRTAGVPLANIEIDTRDTTRDTLLYSHSEFLKGNRETDGRFMVVARLHS